MTKGSIEEANKETERLLALRDQAKLRAEIDSAEKGIVDVEVDSLKKNISLTAGPPMKEGLDR